LGGYKVKKVAILQSNYIPWKGYFDIIHDVDVFVFYDDVQYTNRDWRSRNKIKTPNGSNWLTIPIGSHTNKLICEIELIDQGWKEKHVKSIHHNYSKAPYYKQFKEIIDEVYIERDWTHLSKLNQYLIMTISQRILNLKTTFMDSRDFSVQGDRQDKLINIIKDVGGDLYVSGPAAQSYIQDEKFIEQGIVVEYKQYNGYPEYNQLYPPFDHYVSILDLLFHVGSDAPYYIWGWREDGTSSNNGNL
jgi:hypothetical protein